MPRLYIYQLFNFNLFLKFRKIKGLIPFDFQIIEHFWCIAANYETN